MRGMLGLQLLQHAMAHRVRTSAININKEECCAERWRTQILLLVQSREQDPKPENLLDNDSNIELYVEQARLLVRRIA